jgi:predicted ATPase
VPPLPLPALDDSFQSLTKAPTVELFVKRAQAVRPAFELTNENARFVAEICAKLDGLPLAIELAAARIKLLTPQAMLQRLDRSLKLLVGGARDLPSRQQTIRDTITWSYDLLESSEKTLLRRLSVFVGGCNLEAAEAICGDPDSDVLDGVSSLVDKSLLTRREQQDGEFRLTMLLTIREFALELLDSSAEAESIRQAHTRFFLDLAERAEPELTGAGMKTWLDRLESDHDNLRAALNRALTQNDLQNSLKLTGSLWRFWLVRGHLREGRERLAEVLRATETQPASSERAKALTGAATLAQNQGDYADAREQYEKGLMIRREIGDRHGVASSLTSLGWMAWREGEYDKSQKLSEEGLTLHRELGDSHGALQALNNLGWVAQSRGDFATARTIHEECVAGRRARNDKRALAFSLDSLSWATWKLGDIQRAVALADEAIALIDQVGDRQLQAWAWCVRGGIALDEGASGRAADLLVSSEKQFGEIGDKYGQAFALYLLGQVRFAEGDSGAARQLLEESLSQRRSIVDKHGAAECLDALARVAVAQNHMPEAARMLRTAAALREALGSRLSPAEQKSLDGTRAEVIASMGEEALRAPLAEP